MEMMMMRLMMLKMTILLRLSMMTTMDRVDVVVVVEDCCYGVVSWDPDDR